MFGIDQNSLMLLALAAGAYFYFSRNKAKAGAPLVAPFAGIEAQIRAQGADAYKAGDKLTFQQADAMLATIQATQVATKAADAVNAVQK